MWWPADHLWLRVGRELDDSSVAWSRSCSDRPDELVVSRDVYEVLPRRRGGSLIDTAGPAPVVTGGGRVAVRSNAITLIKAANAAVMPPTVHRYGPMNAGSPRDLCPVASIMTTMATTANGAKERLWGHWSVERYLVEGPRPDGGPTPSTERRRPRSMRVLQQPPWSG